MEKGEGLFRLLWELGGDHHMDNMRSIFKSTACLCKLSECFDCSYSSITVIFRFYANHDRAPNLVDLRFCPASPGTTYSIAVKRQLPPLTIQLACIKSLESIAQSFHRRILFLLYFEGFWYDLDRPTAELRIHPSLENDKEISRMLPINAKCIVAAFRVGFEVCFQPSF